MKAQATVRTLPPRHVAPLAVRHRDAATMLGISEAELRNWVKEGRVHRPYTVKGNVVLFDVARLQDDWERLKRNTAATDAEEDDGENPWDVVLAKTADRK
jgi:hypothetical protein